MEEIIKKYNLKETYIVSLRTKGYFTCKRISPDDIFKLKDNYSHYQIRHGDDQGIPETIEPGVIVNHFGDLLLEKPIKFKDKNDECYNLKKIDKENFMYL